MKKNLNFVYVNKLVNGVIVLDKYGRAMAIKGREVDFAIATGEQKDIIRRRLADPEYNHQMTTEPIGVYHEYNWLHRTLINIVNAIFGGQTK